MTRKGAFLGILIFLAGASASAAESVYQVVGGPRDFYYGHISLVDIRNDGRDPSVLRSGAKVTEPASLNLPIGPGDTILTSKERRVEIQFDNATVVRLDTDSELFIETILARSLSSTNQMSNLVLRRGRIYVMYKQYSTKEMFQVLTPKAAIKLKHNTVAMIGLMADGGSDIQVKYGKASVMYGADLKTPKDLALSAGERVTISAANRFALQDYLPNTDFETWNKAINDDFMGLHAGKTPLPTAIQKLSPAVADFAQRYGNLYGEWINDQYFGYVWRPFYNDHYMGGGPWRPYYAGRWSIYRSQMFWVGSEPWGWIPYHTGLWQWSKTRGWFWIPGSAFAPAWVDWAYFSGSYWSWRPWSMWDWGFYADSWFYNDWMYGDDFYWNWRYQYWAGYGNWGAGIPATDPTEPALTRISKGQLKAPHKPPFEMPKEFKGGLKTLMTALRNKDPEAVESMLAQGGFTVVVDKNNLNAHNIQDKAVPLKDVRAKLAGSASNDRTKSILGAVPFDHATSAFSAAREFSRHLRAEELGGGVGAQTAGDRGATVPRTLPQRVLQSLIPQPSLRTIDWNPDIRMAHKLGLDIRYLSGSNEIYCPQLNIYSSTAHARMSGGNGGSYTAGAGSGGSSGGSSSAGSASSTSSTTSSSGSGGGHIK
jgi:hypothetical protein